MLDLAAKSFVYLLAGYAGMGLLFAIPFVSIGVQRIDSDAKGAGVPFRILILPGVAAFWPIFMARVIRGISEPPIEKNPHR